MNPLTKKTCRRGRTQTHPPSAPVAGSAATRAQVGGTVVNQDGASPMGFVSPRSGASPDGTSWPRTSSSEWLYPPGGFSNFLHSNPYADRPNGDENFHFVGGGMSQSSVSPMDPLHGGGPSPAQQNDDVVAVAEAEEDETININEDSRTDKRLNWSVPEDIRLAVLGCTIQRTQLMEMEGRQMLIGQMLLKITTRP